MQSHRFYQWNNHCVRHRLSKRSTLQNEHLNKHAHKQRINNWLLKGQRSGTHGSYYAEIILCSRQNEHSRAGGRICYNQGSDDDTWGGKECTKCFQITSLSSVYKPYRILGDFAMSSMPDRAVEGYRKGNTPFICTGELPTPFFMPL